MIFLRTFTLCSILFYYPYGKCFAKDNSFKYFLKNYKYQYAQSRNISYYEKDLYKYLPIYKRIGQDFFKDEVSSLANRMSKIDMVEVSHHNLYRCFSPLVNLGQGILCINQNSSNKHFVVAPHPVKDVGSGMLALKVFEKLNARYLYIASISRCSIKMKSVCSGKTAICGKKDNYRWSDFAHHPRNFLQVLTEEFYKSVKNGIQIQIHSCGEKSCPSTKENNIIARLSGGGKQVMPNDFISNKLKINMTKIIAENSLRAKVLSCNMKSEESYRLCASTNLQGRSLNGVVSNPCSVRAKSLSGRFLHIETNYDLRNIIGDDDQINDELLIKALEITLK